MRIYDAIKKEDEYDMALSILTLLADSNLRRLTGDLTDNDAIFAATVHIIKILEQDEGQLEDRRRILGHAMAASGACEEENFGKISDILGSMESGGAA